MNELAQFSSILLNSINSINVSSIACVESISWKSDRQKRKEKVDEIYQQFLKGQDWAEKLDKEVSPNSLFLWHKNDKYRQQKSRNRVKREDYSAKNRIELLNQKLFHKFNVNIDQYIQGNYGFLSPYFLTKSFFSVLIKDWSKYASNWTEFEQKFPEIEFNNIEMKLGGQGSTRTEELRDFKIVNKLSNNFETWNITWTSSIFKEVLPNKNLFCSNLFYNNFNSKNFKDYNLILLESYNYHFFIKQCSYIFIRIYPQGKQLMLQVIIPIFSEMAVWKPWVTIKIDLFRLIGEIDVNPLLSGLENSILLIENWYKSEQNFICYMQNNRDKFEETEIQLRKIAVLNRLNIDFDNFITHYIQNLLLIEHNNQINNLAQEINDIKKRMINLEDGKTCSQNVISEFFKKSTTTFDKGIDEIVTGSNAKNILKVTSKTFATSLLKGPIIGILSCIFEAVVSTTRTKRNVNIASSTEWDTSFVEDINQEYCLLVNDNNFNISTNNMTSNMTGLL